MKRILAAWIVLLGLASLGMAATIAEGTFTVNAQSTYLEQASTDNCTWGFKPSVPACQASFFNPVVINLSTLPTAVNPGDTLQFVVSGSICVSWNGTTATGCGTPGAIGVFSTSSALAASSTTTAAFNRVTGALATPGSTPVSTMMYFNPDGSPTPGNAGV